MRDESGLTSASVSLPAGGGGISPLGDRFEPDLVRGSGNYSVPLQCPKGPNELHHQRRAVAEARWDLSGHCSGTE